MDGGNSWNPPELTSSKETTRKIVGKGSITMLDDELTGVTAKVGMLAGRKLIGCTLLLFPLPTGDGLLVGVE